MSRSLVTVGSGCEAAGEDRGQSVRELRGHDGPRHCQRRGAASALRRCVDLATRVEIDNLLVRCACLSSVAHQRRLYCRVSLTRSVCRATDAAT